MPEVRTETRKHYILTLNEEEAERLELLCQQAGLLRLVDYFPPDEEGRVCATPQMRTLPQDAIVLLSAIGLGLNANA